MRESRIKMENAGISVMGTPKKVREMENKIFCYAYTPVRDFFCFRVARKKKSGKSLLVLCA